MILKNTVTLNLNAYEFGLIMGTMWGKRDDLPRSLKLKLDIEFTKGYLNHPELGEQAKKELATYTKELQELEQAVSD